MSRAFRVQGEVPRILTPHHAERRGITRDAVRHAVRSGRWRMLVDGIVLTTPVTPTRLDWARVGLHIAGPGSVLSGWDAVRARGLGSSNPPDGQVLVLCSDGRNRDRGKVRIRPTTRPYSAVPSYCVLPDYRQLSIVGGARGIADTALLYRTFAPVRALVTSGVQRKVCTPADLAEELATIPRNHSGYF